MTISFDDEFARLRQERWATFCEAAWPDGDPIDANSAAAEALTTAFGLSEFVFNTCRRHPSMALDLMDNGDLFTSCDSDSMDRRLTPLLQILSDANKDDPVNNLLNALKSNLRMFRRREMVRIAVRDLANICDLDETMADLSALATAAINGALNIVYAHMCMTEGTPEDEAGNRQQLVVIGMGKLGAGELNFSSDVDLMFTYPAPGETRGGQRSCSNDTFFTKLCRHLIQVIGENTADGFVFRVDTRLRPYGEGGPLVMNFDHLEDYYQFQGREWERYALIKAAVIAGDREAGGMLLRRLRPFVYRRYLDFGVFESLREMKHKITAEVRRKKLQDNIKLGSGGIREVEFFGQMFQLLRGGVLPALQHPAIQTVLQILAQERFISPIVCQELVDAYRFLRQTEHRLQEMNDQQTHALPSLALDRLRLARSMGFDAWDDYRRVLNDHRRRVRSHFDGLLEPETDADLKLQHDPKTASLSEAWSTLVTGDKRRRLLAQAGFQDPEAVSSLLETFRSEPATRSQSSAGKRRLDRLIPRILDAAMKCDDPETVLGRVLHLLNHIQQRISYLALLLEYPDALTHLVRLVSASPWIAAFVSRHPVLLDELLDPRTLYTPPGPDMLSAELSHRLATVPNNDLEYQIESLCIFRQINTLRVAASDITNVLPLMKVSDHLSWIAETILDKVVDISWNHLVHKHGRPACTLDDQPCRRGFAVIGYGKLGGIELGYGSDLDLVFLHAADTGETIGGERPIDNAHFFSRLGQRVVHMLSAHTAAGTLYETDMRLRPSGSAGLLVSHVNGFRTYQMEAAWTWEHQALIRARPITGDAGLKDAFQAIRHDALSQQRDPQPLKDAVRDMRERMRESRLAPQANQSGSTFDIKEDVGAMVDIEFLVQYLVLQHAATHPELTRWTDNVRLLQSLAETGILDRSTAHRLRQAYLIFRAMAHRLNLQERSTRVDGQRFEHLRSLVRRTWRDMLM